MSKSKVTDREVRAFKPYHNGKGVLVRRLPLGDGLYFEVTSAGLRHFVHRYQWAGKGAERALPGVYPDEIGLAEARALRDADRLLLREGKKPGVQDEVGPDPEVIPTFSEWATAQAANLAPPRPRGARQWLRQMTQATRAKQINFADLPIDEITAQDVKTLLTPYWYATPTQAVVFCQRINRVLKHRHRNIRPSVPFASPADVELIGDMMGRKQKHVVRSHPSLDYEKVPDFMVSLRANPHMSARIVEWAILSGVRIDKEATAARWGEIDIRSGTWTIPASRMKMEDDERGEPHVVPISPGMYRLLRQVRPCRKPNPKALIFPSPQTGGVYTHQPVWMVVKNINPSVTTHGFRTSLTNWGTAIPHGKHGVFDRELMETCLAHRIGGNVTAAYLRDRWVERRRAVMREWSRWCFPAARENVIPMRRAA